jgi:serine/threonine protein phosphatase 1
MSDLHGEYNLYLKMLEKIKFSEEDLLYILGDVIDRGDSGMKILKDMMLRPNVIPIIGNHEYMALSCISWLQREITEESIKRIDENILRGLSEWMNVGGSVSMSEFRKLSMEEKEDIKEYLSDFDLYNTVKVNGKTFILVHAGLDNFSEDREIYDYKLSEMIFNKPDYERVYFKDKYLVTGHTPTRIIHAEQMGISLEEMDQREYDDTIFIKNNHIAIDCAASYGGNLGCICLDTMEEFYV